MSTCDNTANNKRIAKNTVFLYFRMLVTIVISLYTSRVFLEVLGIDDYGLYITVGGIVTFMSFINSALASGSSRFITYALGEGDKQKQKITFSTTLSIHIAIGLLIVLIAETMVFVQQDGNTGGAFGSSSLGISFVGSYGIYEYHTGTLCGNHQRS